MAAAGGFIWKGKRVTDDKVLGISGKLIGRNAATAKKLIKEGYHIETVAGIPTLVRGAQPLVVDAVRKVRNPLTKRLVEVGGRAYGNLIRAGFKSLPDGQLVKGDDLDTLAFDGTYNRDSLKAVIDELTAKYDYEPLLVLTGPGPDGKPVSVEIHRNDIGGVAGAIAEVRDARGSSPDEVFDELAAGGLNLDGFRLDVPLTMDTVELLMAAREDGYCVRDAFETKWPEGDWGFIPDMCGPMELDAIAKRVPCTIRIYDSMSPDADQPSYVFMNGSTANRGKVIELWSQFNHCLLKEKGCKPLELELVIHETKEELYAALDALAQDERVSVVAGGKNSRVANILGFRTETMQHKLRFAGVDLEPQAWTTAGAARRRLARSLAEPSDRYRDLRVAGGLTNHGITYARPRDGKRGPAVTHKYDMKRAYRSYAKCPGFTGFPSLLGGHELVRWDDRMLTDEVEGLALLSVPESPELIEGVSDAGLPRMVKNPAYTSTEYPQTVFEVRGKFRTVWAPLPVVRYAIARGEKPEIHQVLVYQRGGDVLDETNRTFETLVSEEDKGWFHQLVGSLTTTRTQPCIVATSMSECSKAWEKGYRETARADISEGKRVYLMTLGEFEDHDPAFIAIAAYIHGYQKLTMHMDLLSRLGEVGMGWSNVHRIWVDGVELDQPLPEGFLNADRWRYEGVCKAPEGGVEMPPSRSKLIGDIPVGEYNPLLLHPRVAILGGPGSGKSYQVSTVWDTNGRILLKTASTHMAAMVLGDNAVTTQSVTAKAEKAPWELARSDRIVVDEFTLLGKKDLEKVLALNRPVLFCGDFEQLLAHTDAVSEEWLHEQGFHVEKLEGCKRACDDRTRELYLSLRGASIREQLRLCAEAGVRMATTTEAVYPKAGRRAHYIASTNARVDEVNAEYVSRLISAGAKYATAPWGKSSRSELPLAEGMLVAGTRTTDKFRNQEVGVVRGFECLKSGVHAGQVRSVTVFSYATGKEVVVAPGQLCPAFAMTFHRCQGQTYDFPIQIDTGNLFERCMLYVALTRATTLTHVTIMIPFGTSLRCWDGKAEAEDNSSDDDIYDDICEDGGYDDYIDPDW